MLFGGKMSEEKVLSCAYAKKCGGCRYQGVPYEKQLAKKQKQVQELLGKYGKVQKIIGMKNPYFYRNKVHAVFDRDRKVYMSPDPTGLYLLTSA